MQKLNAMAARIDDPRITPIRDKLSAAGSLSVDEADAERTKQAMDDVHDSKRLLARVRRDHLRAIRQLELDRQIDLYRESVMTHARSGEAANIDNLQRIAQRAIDSNSGDFEAHVNELRDRNYVILWRQDYFVINRFKWLARDAFLFPDMAEHTRLVALGQNMLNGNQLDGLRSVVWELDRMRVTNANDDQLASANILRS